MLGWFQGIASSFATLATISLTHCLRGVSEKIATGVGTREAVRYFFYLLGSPVCLVSGFFAPLAILLGLASPSVFPAIFVLALASPSVLPALLVLGLAPPSVLPALLVGVLVAVTAPSTPPLVRTPFAIPLRFYLGLVACQLRAPAFPKPLQYTLFTRNGRCARRVTVLVARVFDESQLRPLVDRLPAGRLGADAAPPPSGQPVVERLPGLRLASAAVSLIFGFGVGDVIAFRCVFRGSAAAILKLLCNIILHQ